MSFTTAQLQAIKSAIAADAEMSADIAAGNPGAVAALLNAVPATGATAVTRTDVSNTELFHCLEPADVSTLAPWQLTMLQLAGQAQVIDFTNPVVASGLGSIFPNTTKTYANIMGIAQRPGTRLEALFTTSGVCATYGAQASVADVLAAMAS